KSVQRREVPARAGELVEGDDRVDLRVSPSGSLDLSPWDLPEAEAIFIDGDHSRFCVEHDTMIARARIRPGGIIIWHDYHDLGTVDVQSVLDEEFGRGRNI